MMAINYQQSVKNQLNLTESFVSEIIKRASNEVSINLDAFKNRLIGIAGSSEIQSMNWDKMNVTLNRYFNSNSDKFTLMFVIAPDGSYYIAGKGLAEKKLNDRQYFKDIFNNHQDFAMTNPDLSKSTGEKKYTVAVPIKNQNQIVGILAANISLSTLSDIVKDLSIGDEGTCFIVDGNTTFIGHKDESKLMDASLDKYSLECEGVAEITDSVKAGKIASNYVKTPNNTTDFMLCYPIKETPNWALVATVSKDEIMQSSKTILYNMVIFGIVILGIIVMVIYLGVNKVIAEPISWLSGIIKNIAQGNLHQKIEYQSNDEIGLISSDLKNMNDKLSDIVTSIKDGAESLAAQSEQVNALSQQLSRGTAEQASSIEDLSSTMQEMSSNIDQNFQNSMETNKMSKKAYTEFSKVVDNLENVYNTSKEIADKIGIVNDIAFQTNILALNAAVEAARAGNSGKGFAVVASEVRKLAEHSKKEADKIVELSQNGLNISSTANSAIKEVLPSIQNATELVDLIANASNEQNSGAMQINNSIQKLSSVVRENSASSEELASSADELEQQAESLKNIISYFK